MHRPPLRNPAGNGELAYLAQVPAFRAHLELKQHQSPIDLVLWWVMHPPPCDCGTVDISDRSTLWLPSRPAELPTRSLYRRDLYVRGSVLIDLVH